MLRHYLEVKAAHPDCVLLYRMGDFFELFFEDAVTAAPILEVTLTARQKGTESEAPMCGVPHHALDIYLAKLIRSGLKVAICDQVEDPAQAKGLVKREVTRIVTPGTVSDPGLLDHAQTNYLAAVAWQESAGAGSFLDISTGRFLIRRWSSTEQALDDLAILRPQELLYLEGSLPPEILDWVEAREICSTAVPLDGWPSGSEAAALLQRRLGTITLKGYGLDDGEPALRSAGAALRYAQETQQSDLSHIGELQVVDTSSSMTLDSVTVANLEIFENQRDGKKRGSLLWILDRTCTAGGGRRLEEWLQQPLTDPETIRERQDAVEMLLEDSGIRDELSSLLEKFGDLERIVTRAVLENLTAREAVTLRNTLQVAPRLVAGLQGLASGLLKQIAETDLVSDLADELSRVLADDPPQSLKEGGVIRPGVNSELDHYRSLVRDSRKHILELEARERKSSGINSLKIRFNRVFGYYIEVTKANQGLVPDHYVRKQTLVNSERYITDELKELEEQILLAESEQMRLEQLEFRRVEALIANLAARLRRLASAVSTLDVLVSFAEVAARGSYIRPEMLALGEPLEIVGGRHPVVESMSDEEFVPNDTYLDSASARIVILTGPNMGGKSTFLRQTALIVLMAQIGSFIPAEAARIGAVDRIFSRVGASDDLSRGESTFMVEMIETARILHQSTANSLVILDEVGRGTATFDGLSLAWAIVEYLHATTNPKTLFATHYHELTELAVTLDGVVNRTLTVKEWRDSIVFLRRVVPGASDKSYGIHVARLAGIPQPVIDRAGQILSNLEAQEYDMKGRPRIARGGPENESEEIDQLSLFAPPEEIVASLLREVDIECLSPLAALNLLNALKARLDPES